MTPVPCVPALYPPPTCRLHPLPRHISSSIVCQKYRRWILFEDVCGRLWEQVSIESFCRLLFQVLSVDPESGTAEQARFGNLVKAYFF